MNELTNSDAILDALLGRSIVAVSVHTDREGGIDAIDIDLDDGTRVHLSAHGMQTEGWIIVEAEHNTGGSPK